jgi:hypothetical protein
MIRVFWGVVRIICCRVAWARRGKARPTAAAAPSPPRLPASAQALLEYFFITPFTYMFDILAVFSFVFLDVTSDL